MERLTGWRARTSFDDGLATHDRLVPRERGLVERGTGAPERRRRRLLVLGAGAAQLGLLEAARALDLFVIAVDRDPAAPGFPLADRRAIISTEDEPGIERLAEAERINGVIAPGIDWPVAVAARVAKRLALAHPLTPEVAQLAISKVKQRERFGEAGVPQPRTEIAQEPRGGARRGRAARLPVRREGAGPAGPARARARRGRGVVRQRRWTPRSRRRGRASCLVEELIDGQEVTVNAFSLDGRFHPLTVTDRVRADPPAFGVALAHVWPSALAPAQVGAAVEAAREAAAALGIENGPTYTQVVVGSQGAKVVELAARLGGGHDAELCEAALGVDLNELALAAALGEPIPRAGARAARAGRRRGDAVPDRAARRAARRRGSRRRARGRRRRARADLPHSPGWRFGELRIGSDRAGAVQAVGDSRAQALERAAAAAERIRFVTADVDAKALA